MPFSRTLKAGLVAMVLIVLTAVPRLDAAPMENFQPWMRELSNIGKKAKLPDLNEQAVGASFESAFQPVHPGEELQRGPQTPLPFGNQPWSTVGLPSWSSWNHPSGPTSSHPVSRPEPYHLQGTVGSSYGTAAARHEVGHASTSGGSRVTIALDAATREAAFRGTPVEEEPWSNEDILKILEGDQWKGLSRNNKAAYLKLFGEKVFTMDFYNRLPNLEENGLWKNSENSALTKKLVDEYFQLRMADGVKRPLQLDFKDGARPSAKSFWTYQDIHFPLEGAVSDTLDPISDHPFKPFRLGVFSINLYSNGKGLAAKSAWNALNNPSRIIKPVNVVAGVSRLDRVYIGQARIKRAKLDNAKPT